MYQLSFYVSESALGAVKKAVFEAGAGEYGHFKNCAWETLGNGQYQSSDDETLVQQPEYKVEVLCRAGCLNTVLEALKSAHPCDEPPFYLTKIDHFEMG